MGNAQVDIGRLPVTSGVVKNFPRSSFVMKLVTLPVLCLWLR